MKASLVVLSSAFLLSAPTFTHAAEDALNTSLASATARAMNVAPWVKVSVVKVVADDQLNWLARSSGGQFYLCSAAPDAVAVSSGQVSCARATATAAERARAYQLRAEYKLLAVSDIQDKAWADAQALAAQNKRMRLTIPAHMTGETPFYTPTVTLSAQ